MAGRENSIERFEYHPELVFRQDALRAVPGGKLSKQGK
jgi:hypothetical protein